MHQTDLIDIYETTMDAEILSALLKDHSSAKNLIWATDDYASLGEGYSFDNHIYAALITGENGKVIRPRTAKSRDEQERRIRDKAEVFTPSWICNEQNNLVDDAWFGRPCERFNRKRGEGWKTRYRKVTFPKEKTWQDYVLAQRLEVSCGEAPYLTSRYDTVTGKFIPVKKRIGLLDRKLRIITENVEDASQWFEWAKKAVQSTYGFDWQGDNVLLARENILYAVIESYHEQFEERPDKDYLLQIANIISWNIWQMDGLKFVIPNSCHPIEEPQINLLDSPKLLECPGCKTDDKFKHTGVYCKITDWQSNETIRFVDMLKGGN